jgi:hypothetical protein
LPTVEQDVIRTELHAKRAGQSCTRQPLHTRFCNFYTVAPRRVARGHALSARSTRDARVVTLKSRRDGRYQNGARVSVMG